MNVATTELLRPVAGRMYPTGDIALYIAEEGHGRPVVFLHGLGWQHGLWRPQISRYRNRYRVLVGDNRGHGRSNRPSGPYSIRDMAGDWLRVFDRLELAEWALVGFSQGGMIAQWIAALAPARTSALAVIGASCRSNPVIRDAMEKRLAAARESAQSAAEVAGRSIFSPEFIARQPEFFAAFVADRARMPLEPLAAATRALYDFDVSTELSRVTCPSFVAIGAQDRLVPVESAREVASRIAGAGFSIVPEAGHMVTIEQPTAFDALLDEFLAAHYAPSGVPPCTRGDTR